MGEMAEKEEQEARAKLKKLQLEDEEDGQQHGGKRTQAPKGGDFEKGHEQIAKTKTERPVISSTDLNVHEVVRAVQTAADVREEDKEAETKKQAAAMRVEEIKAKLGGRGTSKQEPVDPNAEASTANGAQWGVPRGWEDERPMLDARGPIKAKQKATDAREKDGEVERKRQATKMKLDEMKNKFAAKAPAMLKDVKPEPANPNVEASTANGAQLSEPKDWEDGSDDDGDDDDGYDSDDYDADVLYGQATGSGWL